MKKRYLPVMKLKPAELAALRELYPATWELLNPLLELQEDALSSMGSDHVSESVQKTLEAISKCCQKGRLIFIDFDAVGECPDTMHNEFLQLLEGAHSLDINLAPVISHFSTNCISDAVRCYGEVSNDRSIGYRIRFENLGADCRQGVLDDLERVNILPARVHLIVDYDYVTEIQEQAYRGVLTHYVEQLSALECASITLSGTSYPRVLNVEGGTVGDVFRVEWSMWNMIRQSNALKDLRIDYGDYTITNPELVDFDVRKMTVAAKIVYTLENTWRVYKGRSTRKYTWEQIYALAGAVARSPEFRGAAYSAGEAHIVRCANRETTSGNATTWKRVGITQHLTFVAQQVANQI